MSAISQKSEDELKVTRRLFLQHAATATAVSATLYSVAMKTDAIAQPPLAAFGTRGTGDGMPYPYVGA